MMSAQSLASFCCSSRKCWCSCASSQVMARSTSALPAPLAARQRAAHVVCRDQPPQRGVDAAEVPEIGLAVFSVDVLRDLPVAGLMRGQRVQAVQCALLERGDAAAVHRQHAHRRIAPEHARVAPRLGRRRWRWRRGCRPATGFAPATGATRSVHASINRGRVSRSSRLMPRLHAADAVRRPENRAAIRPPASAGRGHERLPVI